MKPSKKQWFCVAVFLLLLFSGLAGFAVFLVRERHRGFAYADALQAYDSGDLPTAKKMFEAIVRGDGNQENAYVHLAEIACREGNWREEALCWGYARTLNPLEPGYRTRQKDALAREGNFTVLQNLFFSSFNGDELLSDEDSFYFLFPGETERRGPARERYRQFLEKNRPAFFSTEFGRLIGLVESGSVSPETAEALIVLGGSAHPVVAFEALIRAAAVRSACAAPPEEIEKLLLAAAEKNAFSGLFHLENFYIEHLRFDRAVSVCRRNFSLFRRPASAIKLAELYVLTGDAEKIGALLPEFSGGGRAVLVTACYLESLRAFARGNPEETGRQFKQTGGAVKTPLSALVGLYAAVNGGNAAGIERAWEDFRLMPEFYDLPQRADTLMSAGIDAQIAAGNSEEAARLLSLPGVRPFRNVPQTRCLIGRKLQNGSLRESELEEALKRFPGDPVLLQSAAEYFYRRAEYARSMAFADRAAAADRTENTGILLLRILNLAALGRTEEASKVLLEAASGHPDDARLIFSACRFSAANKRPGDLERICGLLRGAKSPLLPYAQGELFLLKGNIPEALEQFGQVRSGVPEMLFRAAKILGEHDCAAPASAIYRILLDGKEANPVLRAFALANLAELYASAGNGGKALECAEKAWALSPGRPSIRLCYARQLRKNGQLERILTVFSGIPDGKTREDGLRAIWIEAAELEIERLFDAGRKADAERLCLRLLAAAPASESGRAFLKKLKPEKETRK